MDAERALGGARQAIGPAGLFGGGSCLLCLGGSLGCFLSDLARGLGGGRLHLLGDTRRLAAPVAQIIELSTAHLAAPQHLDRFDIRRKHWENALDALAIGNFAYREALVDPAAVAGDADAFIGLHAGPLAFRHLDVYDDSVARLKRRDSLASRELGGLRGLKFRDDIH